MRIHNFYPSKSDTPLSCHDQFQQTGINFLQSSPPMSWIPTFCRFPTPPFLNSNAVHIQIIVLNLGTEHLLFPCGQTQSAILRYLASQSFFSPQTNFLPSIIIHLLHHPPFFDIHKHTSGPTHHLEHPLPYEPRLSTHHPHQGSALCIANYYGSLHSQLLWLSA
jgi:hypothetical protein